MSDAAFDLDRIERWMQTVIMNPDGVAAGMATEAARRHIDVAPEDAESVISRSQALDSVERLEIYNRAYFARLLECLRGEFFVLAKTFGEEIFDAFAFGYLQSYPSRSYTLNHLGANFAKFLEESRPALAVDDPDLPPEMASWPDFLVDMARLEWAINEVFDGPGFEGQPTLDAQQLLRIPAEQWPLARLEPAPCLRLLSLRFPVNQFYTAIRNGDEPGPPLPGASYVALTRIDYVVRRFDLSQTQFELLESLANGTTVGDAVARAAAYAPEDFDQFARDLRTWFQDWAAAGFFAKAY